MNIDIKVGAIEVSISNSELTTRQAKNLVDYVVFKSMEMDANDFKLQAQAHSFVAVNDMNGTDTVN